MNLPNHPSACSSVRLLVITLPALLAPFSLPAADLLRVLPVTDEVFMRSLFLQRRGIVKDLAEFGREYPRSHHPDINEFVACKVDGEGGNIHDPKPVKGLIISS